MSDTQYTVKASSLLVFPFILKAYVIKIKTNINNWNAEDGKKERILSSLVTDRTVNANVNVLTTI